MIRPSDWEIVELGLVAKIYSGGTPSRATGTYWGGSIPWATTTEVDGTVITTTKESISTTGLVNSAAKIAPAGTLLMAMYGQGKTRGRTSMLGIDAAMNQACAAIEPTPRVDAEYLLAYLQHNYEMIRGLSNSGGQENLSGQIVKRIPVALPPLAEQRMIAAAHRDAQAQVTAIDRLIAKKQAIKQGMMQQVFMLPELERERAALGTIASMLSGGTPDRSNDAYWAGDIPWISATTLKRVEVSSSDQRVSEAAVRAGSRMAPLNATLILVRGSALHSEVRASLVVAPVCFNQDVKAMVPLPGVEPKFLTYSIHANSDRLLRLITSAGNTAGVLDTKVLKDFEIWLPDRKTQRRVVATFDDVSGELDALAARLSKARDIKTGMMQQLLTGRTRLPMEAAS